MKVALVSRRKSRSFEKSRMKVVKSPVVASPTPIGGDVRGLDDDDLEVVRAASAFPEAREVDRRQPAGGATSDDDDLLDAGVHGGV